MPPLNESQVADAVDRSALLTAAEVLKLPYYVHGKGGKPSHEITLYRNRKIGKIAPDGKRHFLRGVRTAGGWHYRREDVEAFHRAMNGDPVSPQPNHTEMMPPPASADADERELQEAGLL